MKKPEPAKSPRSPSPAATRTPERVSVVTLELNPRDGETELLFRHEGFFDEKARDNHEKGWSGLLGQLQAHLQRS